MSDQTGTADNALRTKRALTNRDQNFMRRRITAVKQGGFGVLGNYAFMAVGLSLALLPVLFIRLIRPIVTVRFAEFSTSRIGPFASIPEIYMCERDAGMHASRTVDIFNHQRLVSNFQLKKMWNRSLRVTPLAKYMRIISNWLPGSKAHLVPFKRRPEMDTRNLMETTEPHVSFTAQEEAMGQRELRRRGIPEGAPFVCFHCRDSNYLKVMFPGKDYLRRHDGRDVALANYIPAVDELTNRGYYALRMGAVVQDDLETDNPNIIDCAGEHRSDFMDIYLMAKCDFFLASASGMGTGVPMLFRRPIAMTNFMPLEYINSRSRDFLFIPKKLWHTTEKRFLGFPEILGERIGRWQDKAQFDQGGIELIENTPDEISAIALEMDQRLKGTWESQDDDEELQSRFWSLWEFSEFHGTIRARIGAEFLRQNREMLD